MNKIPSIGMITFILISSLSSNGQLAVAENTPIAHIDNYPMTDSNASYNEAHYNSYNTNRSDSISPTYMDNPTGTEYDAYRTFRDAYGVNSNLSRQYNTIDDYDYNRAAVNTITSSATINEADLIGALNTRGRAIYLSLDAEGKSLAMQLASEDSYHDKNLAVFEAQRRMRERRGLMNLR